MNGKYFVQIRIRRIIGLLGESWIHLSIQLGQHGGHLQRFWHTENGNSHTIVECVAVKKYFSFLQNAYQHYEYKNYML